MDTSRYRRYGRIVAPALKSQRVRAHGILILSLLTASFFVVFAIRPTTSTIAQLRRQIKDSQYVDQKLGEKINTLTTLDRTYKELEKDLVYVEASLPSQANVRNLLAALEEVASDSRLEISSIQMRPVDLVDSRTKEDSFQVKPISFQIAFRGGYQDLTQALSLLNRVSRLVTVKNIEIKKVKGGQGTESGTLTLELEGTGFYVN
jgi:Tfp pilus assembly protein PilO